MENLELMFPITPENFPVVWAWVDDKRKKTVIRKRVRKISGVVAELVFLLLMCIAMFGYYLQVDGNYFPQYLQKIPVLPEIWAVLENWITPLELWQQLAVIAVAIYLLSFACAALSAGLVVLLCHPDGKCLPDGDLRENARLLEVATEKVVDVASVKYRSGSVLYSSLFLLLNAALVCAFVVQLSSAQDMEIMYSVMSKLNGSVIGILTLCCWVGYGVLYFPMVHLVRILYILKLPEDLLQQVKVYSLQCDPERKARLEEEDRILALAQQIKINRRKEREEMLRK